MRDVRWEKLHQDAFLVGENFGPGKNPMINAREFTREWQRMRKALNMPKQYQFYSLRDTGIVHMLRSGVPIDDVMKQAGHTILETTTRYVRHPSPEAVAALKRMKKGF